MLRLCLDIGEKGFLGLIDGHHCNLDKLLFLLIDAALQKRLVFRELTFLPGQFLLLEKKFLFLAGGLLYFFLKAAADIFQLMFPGLEFAFSFSEFVFLFPLLIEEVILALKNNFLLLGLGFLSGLQDDAPRQPVRVTKPFGDDGLVQDYAYGESHNCRGSYIDNEQPIHPRPHFILNDRAFAPGKHRQTSSAGKDKKKPAEAGSDFQKHRRNHTGGVAGGTMDCAKV